MRESDLSMAAVSPPLTHFGDLQPSVRPVDHAAMGHETTDHGGMDHGGMSHGGASQCSMSMVWNYDYENLCLVFPSWRITSATSLYTSMVMIVMLGVAYEWLRLALKRLDRRLHPPASPGKRATASLRRSRLASGSSAPIGSKRVDDTTKKGILISSLQPDATSSRRTTPTLGSSSSNETDSDPAAPLLYDPDRPYEARGVCARESVSAIGLFSVPILVLPARHQIVRSVGYAVSVAFSFFLMLLFMTYNAYIIAAVVIGAGIGNYFFNRPGGDSTPESEQDEEDRGMACH